MLDAHSLLDQKQSDKLGELHPEKKVQVNFSSELPRK